MGFSRTFGAFARSHMDLARFGKGFRTRSLAVDQLQWSYLERPAQSAGDVPVDKSEVVVFLHALGTTKEAWLRVASSIARRYRVVIPDLPGHGKTTPLDARMNHAADRQARRLHEFFEAELGPKTKVHLVGTCMGATIAGVYASMHPTRVKSLTMLAPWGISSSMLSDLEDTTKQSVLSPTAVSTSDLGDWGLRGTTSSSGSGYTPSVFSSLQKANRMRRREHPVLEKVMADTVAHPTILEDELRFIRSKSLAIWGRQDQVLDVSCLDVLDEKLGAEQKHVLVFDECGHRVENEKPGECADILNKFIADEELSFTCALAGGEALMTF